MKLKTALRSFLAVTGSSLLAISYTHATTFIWDGDTGTAGAQDVAGTFTWASGDLKFWDGSANVATTDDITTDIAQFGNSGTLATPATINVSTQSINGLIFDTTTTSGYTLSATSAQALTIGGSGILMNSGAQAISVGSANLGLTLGAAQSWTNNDNSLLTIGGAVNKAGNLLTIAGTGNTTISGKISGAGGLTKNDGGTLTLGANNDFSGGMILNAGTLAGTSVQSFGTLLVNGGNLGSGTFLNAIDVTFAGSSSIATGTSVIKSAQIDSAAIVTLNGAASGNGTASYTFTNGLSGSGKVQFVGGTSNAPQSKILDIKNSSGFTGDLETFYVSNGVVSQLLFSDLGDGGKIVMGSGGGMRQPLQITYSGSGNTFSTRQLEFANSGAFNTGMTIESNGSGALVFNTALLVSSSTNGKTLTLAGTTIGLNNAFNGAIANGGGTAVISVAKSGASTWILSNTANTYTGGTSLTGGTLQFTKTAAMPGAGVVAVGTGTTLVVNAGAASGEWTNATSGNGSIGGLLAGLGGQVGGTVSYTGAVTLGIDTSNATAGTMTYSGVIPNKGTSLGLTKLGTGTLVLDQANTYTGTTNVTGGTLALANNLALQFSALTFAAGTQLDLSGAATPTIGGLNSSVNLASVTGYNTNVTALNLNPGTGVSATYSGILSNGAATNLPLTKTGAGTQTLSNASNSFSGNITINNGNLTFSNTGSWGGASKNVTFTGAATVTSSGNGYSGGAIDTGGFFATIAGHNTTFASATGAGTLLYIGQVSNGSTLNIGNASALTGNLRVDIGGTTNAAPAVRFSSLSDSGGSKIQFGGTNSNSAQNATASYQGNAPLVFNNRVIEILLPPSSNGPQYNKVSSDSTSAANTWTINTNLSMLSTASRELELTGTNTGNNAFNGLISNGSGTIKLNKTGTGTWNVTNASNNYTGGTAVSAGTLGFASGVLGTTGSINASGGTLLWLPGNTQDISSRLAMTAATTSTFHTNGNDVSFASAVGSATTGNLAKTGLGTLTLGGTNTYTGSTTLNAGKLKLDYSTNDTSKLSNTASTGTLLLNGGTLELSGSAGNHVETVLSTTLNTGGTFITQPTGGATLSMGGITFTGGAIDFAEDNIAATTTGVTNGILSQRATVAGTNFAMKSGSNIVAYNYATNGVTGYTGTAMSANINYALQTAGGANTLSVTTGATSNTLKIANTATGSLAVAANTLTIGTILFTGSADYDITTSGAGKITPSILHNFGTGGAVLNLGALGGSLTQFGTGKTILNNAATTNSTLNINGGTVQISANNQIGTNSGVVAITLNNGTLLASETLALNNAGANSRTVTLGAGGGTLAAASTKTLTVSGVISGALNPLTVGSIGNTGTVNLSAVNTYSGFTNVDAGTLNVASTGTINTTSAINVAAGGTLRYNSSTALVVGPTLAGNTISNRAILGGTGTIGASITLDNLGDVLSPGNSPGIQSYNVAQTWSSFSYDWEVNDWTGTTAGSDFDQLNLTTLSLPGGSGSYILNVLGLTAGDVAGLVGAGGGNLFAETDRSWTILTSTGITGFNALNWTINTGGFTDPDAGLWSLDKVGNNLVLSYASVPEPNVAALIGGFGVLMLLRRRR